MGMTQTYDAKFTEITELITAIAKYGRHAVRDISRLHAIAPTARLEIIELVDEADNNSALHATVERLETLLQNDLRYQVTVRLGIVTHAFVDELVSAALAYGYVRLRGQDTTKLAKILDVMRHDLEKAGFVDLYDVAVLYGLNRARRQRSTRLINGIVDAIRALTK
jgi:hypothetical protein